MSGWREGLGTTSGARDKIYAGRGEEKSATLDVSCLNACKHELGVS